MKETFFELPEISSNKTSSKVVRLADAGKHYGLEGGMMGSVSQLESCIDRRCRCLQVTPV